MTNITKIKVGDIIKVTGPVDNNTWRAGDLAEVLAVNEYEIDVTYKNGHSQHMYGGRTAWHISPENILEHFPKTDTTPTPEIPNGTYWAYSITDPKMIWWEIAVKDETAVFYIMGDHKRISNADYDFALKVKSGNSRRHVWCAENPNKPEIEDGTYWVSESPNRFWRVDVKDDKATWFVKDTNDSTICTNDDTALRAFQGKIKHLTWHTEYPYKPKPGHELDALDKSLKYISHAKSGEPNDGTIMWFENDMWNWQFEYSRIRHELQRDDQDIIDELVNGLSVWEKPVPYVEKSEIEDGTYWVTSSTKVWEVTAKDGKNKWVALPERLEVPASEGLIKRVRDGESPFKFHTKHPQPLIELDKSKRYISKDNGTAGYKSADDIFLDYNSEKGQWEWSFKSDGFRAAVTDDEGTLRDAVRGETNWAKPVKFKPELANGTYWVTSNYQPKRYWWKVIVTDETAKWYMSGNDYVSSKNYEYAVHLSKEGSKRNTWHTTEAGRLQAQLAHLDKAKTYVSKSTGRDNSVDIHTFFDQDAWMWKFSDSTFTHPILSQSTVDSIMGLDDEWKSPVVHEPTYAEKHKLDPEKKYKAMTTYRTSNDWYVIKFRKGEWKIGFVNDGFVPLVGNLPILSDPVEFEPKPEWKLKLEAAGHSTKDRWVSNDSGYLQRINKEGDWEFRPSKDDEWDKWSTVDEFLEVLADTSDHAEGFIKLPRKK